MLTVTDDRYARPAIGFTRRDFLQVGSLGAGGFTLADLISMEAISTNDRVASRDERHQGSDRRSVIMICNLGAPSQLDTFDPKPEAPREIRGPFSTIQTASPEIFLTEILPQHAAIAEKFSIIRSCYHNAPALHDVGWQYLQTGRYSTGSWQSPHVGSVASYLKEKRAGLPPFVVLPARRDAGRDPRADQQTGRFLGKAYDPLVLNDDPSLPHFSGAERNVPPSLGTVKLDRRQKLRSVVESSLSQFEKSESATQLGSHGEAAFRLISSPEARAAFDLANEPDAVRDQYGRSRFGQSCLLARRLIEAGVRFVTINTFLNIETEITWDVHGTHPFASVEEMKSLIAPMYDQGYATLIRDLEERGMLNDTLVCNLAEFGRTPMINSAGGRDHWTKCWSVGFAGGGVQGGRIVGKSDALGGSPIERPVSPPEILATIYHSLGIDIEHPLPGPDGSSFPLVDGQAQPVMELFA
ncbi:protein of unknown function DUF1501 [Planctopirus limnophila DSM 3776]|uniref:DUF1501 domain-containing protein n=1 Tax=Planctopirus limnophila (strain ATCC 43296 / DSM 3776 / IFAM 1008 / Mu 290) TaxID=521674 RepID=D5SUP4_PLAL2|nr:DUF1501 domain-containing protein [Planctopirus limnophila]ADG67096.1 protein of unknown function DUF1501 [Planctopirus limnophila DSM 3776]